MREPFEPYMSRLLRDMKLAPFLDSGVFGGFLARLVVTGLAGL